MSLKNRDEHNRWRNKTIAFRVSPEENEQIERYVQLSGLTKQDYITRRLTHRDVVVQGNPRVFKALRNQLAEVLWKLQRIETVGAVNDELLDLIEMIADILGGMKEEFECPTKIEMTAPNVSVGADTEQSSQNLIDNSLTDFDPNFKRFDAVQRKFLQMMDPSYLKTVSMSELLDNVYQSKPSLVDGLLYRGTYLFVGAPKLGKSFLMTQLAYHISTGTPLWNYPVHKGTVLYLALEGDYRRLQERSYRMFGTAENESLFFSVSAGQLGRGLDEQLTNFLREHPDTSLIIIDTLQKVREIGGDNYSYANDYQIITRLKALADNHGICLLLVHHTRKQQADDKFDMISGTNGLLGAADGAFLLTKEKRTGNAACLDVSGRDQLDQQLHLFRNEETLAWELERVETELWKSPPEPLLEQISAFLSLDRKEWMGTPTELAALLGVDMKPNALTRRLNVNAGRLLNEYGIRYESSRSRSERTVELTADQA